MKKVQRVDSYDKKRLIEIIKDKNNTFSIRRFVKKYDAEEEVEYIVQETPGSDGIYGDVNIAIAEAYRILEMTAE